MVLHLLVAAIGVVPLVDGHDRLAPVMAERLSAIGFSFPGKKSMSVEILWGAMRSDDADTDVPSTTVESLAVLLLFYAMRPASAI